MGVLNWKNTSLLLIGAGGIGSALVPLLARLPMSRLTIQDDEKVGKENLVTQRFARREIGVYKAVSLAEEFGDIGRIESNIRRFTGALPCVDDIVIAAVDSLESRRAIWKGVTSEGSRTTLYVDGRLSRDTPSFFHLFAIDMQVQEHRQVYEQFLVGEGEPDSKRRDIDMIPTPAVLSGIILQVLIGWSRGGKVPWQVVFDGASISLTPFFA